LHLRENAGYLERVCDCPIVEGLKFVVVGLDIPAVKVRYEFNYCITST